MGGDGGCDYHVSRQVCGGGGGVRNAYFSNKQVVHDWGGGGGGCDYHVSRQGGAWVGQKCLPFQQTGGSWPGVTRSWAPALEPESELSA